MNQRETVARRGCYRRFFAWLISRLSPRVDEELGSRKRDLLGKLAGTVVEIGAGTGANLRYLGDAARTIAVEPNMHMHEYLRRAARDSGVEIEIRAGAAESLPLDDSEADAVVSTLVLCSVDDVPAVLEEIRRVLRPGGEFVFLEHVAAPAGSRLRRWQSRIKPLWRRIGDGCEPDRDLASFIEAAGFARVQIERFDVSASIPLVRPHIAGVAIQEGG